MKDEQIHMMSITRRSRKSVSCFFIQTAWATFWPSWCPILLDSGRFEPCAKAAKYLRYVLQELDDLREGPTPLYIDNQAAIVIINKNWPTTRASHIKFNISPFKSGELRRSCLCGTFQGLSIPATTWPKPLVGSFIPGMRAGVWATIELVPHKT